MNFFQNFSGLNATLFVLNGVYYSTFLASCQLLIFRTFRTNSGSFHWSVALPAELYPHGLETLDITGFLRYSVVMFCGWFYWSVALPAELYPHMKFSGNFSEMKPLIFCQTLLIVKQISENVK